ncbi:GNAT family N-acetyltransferase [Streptomyces griseoincarnatus]|uniref:GNAT family N-acetyltransferase n=1 Tax=Streptomyces sp. SMS_SU21 TaxID=2069440 RepID=UPI000C87EB74|nr:GNAT family N-acetyltransferase [Streptomyces sp. SMS_SU21]MCA2204598.1 GNAT family N-acetyltransferase [Streptomyces sp. SMS_SU21]NEA92891.1 GNAT family N-acetyltransferase [Actinospica acidiphila]PWE11834.1 N-acetyltransferase [Streptomyces sp. BSE7F]
MPTAADTALTFRDATDADVDALVELIESAYRGESSRTGWTTEADILHGQRTDREAVLEVVEAPDSRLLTVEREGRIVACCHLEHRGEHAYFGMFAVSPALQGAGLGRTVIAEAERQAREGWGVTEMHMTVITVREDLIAWYERRGYRRTGKTAPFPYGDERFGVPQRDDLQFELLVKELVRPSCTVRPLTP